MSKPAKTWDFTLNNYTDLDIGMLNNWTEQVASLLVSKEVGENGTPHLQGRVTFKRAYRLTGVKKLHSKCHWEITKCPQDSLYVIKEGSDVIINQVKKRAAREDLTSARTAILAHNCWKDVMSDAALEPVVRKYMNWCKEVWVTKPAPAFDLEELRPWQRELVDEFAVPAGDRKIIWLCDEKGGMGKTVLSKYLATRGAFYFKNGKTADIAYAYQMETTIIMDLTRSVEGHVNYEIMEALKDGIVFSGKYQSCSKIRTEAAHFCVMSNFMPDMTKLSADRWDVRNY
jgi:hypothetical protein